MRLERDNVSIENQKAIIEDFIKHKFPDSSLTFYEDRDRSGYTFEQREGYQKMRRGLMSHKYDILVVKDFSRFSRRNSRGLVELEDLRDAGDRHLQKGAQCHQALSGGPLTDNVVTVGAILCGDDRAGEASGDEYISKKYN